MTSPYAPPKHVLPVIVFAQFACTSLWFAGNAVIDRMAAHYGFGPEAIAHLTSAVQFGFITGTLLFAFLTISDRYSPSKVFLASAIAGAVFNCGVLMQGNTFTTILVWRFATGFFLAGIYPVGMKIASDYHQQGLGKALGFLVGALVVGTALPHGLRSLTQGLDWRIVMIGTSGLAIIGGLSIAGAVPDGPFRRAAVRLDLRSFLHVFRSRDFRGAAFGYFGHMWELYTFWAFVPLMVVSYAGLHTGIHWDVPLLAFLVIGIGGLSCVAGGYVALVRGSASVALVALISSGLCCLLSPIMFGLPPALFIAFLLFWGVVVIADSPQFSTLVAQTAPADKVGTALTIVNCIGFAITILSMQLLSMLHAHTKSHWIYVVLVIGPVFGILSMLPLVRKLGVNK